MAKKICDKDWRPGLRRHGGLKKGQVDEVEGRLEVAHDLWGDVTIKDGITHIGLIDTIDTGCTHEVDRFLLEAPGRKVREAEVVACVGVEEDARKVIRLEEGEGNLDRVLLAHQLPPFVVLDFQRGLESDLHPIEASVRKGIVLEVLRRHFLV